jgi:hypothetical protein
LERTPNQAERILMTVRDGDFQKVLQEFAVLVDANAIDELTLEGILERAKRVGSAKYSKSKHSSLKNSISLMSSDYTNSFGREILF